MEISTNNIKPCQLGGEAREKSDADQINRADWITDQKFELQKF